MRPSIHVPFYRVNRQGSFCFVSIAYALSFVPWSILPAVAQEHFALDTNASVTVPGAIDAPFGKIRVTGHSDDQPDSDLGAGRVYANVPPTMPSSSAIGTGEIRLVGALATEISFRYGIQGDQNSGSVGGFTAYGFSESMSKANPKMPGEVFKQFAVNAGQPTGPATIRGLPADPATNPTGTKYFNGFRWTSSTKANDVLTNTRSGKAQIKDVRITFERASDIFADRGSFPAPTKAGPVLTVVFDARGKSGVVVLENLARAIDPKFDHFNWVQTMELKSANPTLERIKLKASDFSVTTGNFSDPHVDPHTNNGERLAYIKNKGTPQERGYLIGVEGAELTPSGQTPDQLILYLNEGLTTPEWKQFVTPTSLLFKDAPSMPVEFFEPGDVINFRTELHAVSPDGSESKPLGVGFEWKSDARRKLVDQKLLPAGGGILDIKFFGLK